MGKGGKAVKEENAKVKDAQKKKEAEQKEADKWKDGAKSKDMSKEEKRAAELARKNEAARLLAAEEASMPSKPKAKAGGTASKTKKVEKKVERPAGPGAIAAGGGLASMKVAEADPTEPVVHLEATGIDNMLDALEIVNTKTDKASMGSKAAEVEAHPERRFKAALEKYMEEELPIIRKEQPGLRLQQYKERLFKQFQKHPDNPFNQVTVDYNATKEDKVGAFKASLAEKERRLQQPQRNLD